MIIANRSTSEIPTPKKAIRDFFLLHCQLKDKENSKRAVAQCLHRKCPLHPYRTGQLRMRYEPMQDGEHKSWAKRLEMARKQVTYAENNLRREIEHLEFRQGVFQNYVDRVEKAKKRVEDAKENVRDIEIAFDEALRGAKWK